MSDDPITLYCANHPDTATSLRCNRCEKPICTKCAVLTPTGYRCRECVRGQQKVFDTSQWYDYPLTFIVAAGLSFLGSMLVTRIGFFTIFLAPFAGIVIAEAIRLIVKKRRAKRLFQLAALATVLGALPFIVIGFFSMISGGYYFMNLIWLGVYLLFVPSTVYARLSGINVRR